MVKHDFPTPPPPTTTSLYSRRNWAQVSGPQADGGEQHAPLKPLWMGDARPRGIARQTRWAALLWCSGQEAERCSNEEAGTGPCSCWSIEAERKVRGGAGQACRAEGAIGAGVGMGAAGRRWAELTVLEADSLERMGAGSQRAAKTTRSCLGCCGR